MGAGTVIERAFYCDGPGCNGHQRSIATRPGPSWVTVTENGSSRTLHFCLWDCVLKYAAAQEPVEIIPFGEHPGADS
jgi:hypothetical protein